MSTIKPDLTTAQFIEREKITATLVRRDENRNMDDMPQGSSHWTVTLRRGQSRMSTPFSRGPAIKDDPTAADVLDCLASDASGAEGSFEDWCAELGYDTDSRKAERTYKAVSAQTAKLRYFLGPELFEELVYRTVRS